MHCGKRRQHVFESSPLVYHCASITLLDSVKIKIYAANFRDITFFFSVHASTYKNLPPTLPTMQLSH